MIRRLLTVFLLAVCVPAVGLLSQPTPCEACSCRTPALDEAVSRSGSVFAGKVLEIKWVPDPYESNGALAYKHAVRFEVERTFKGPDTSQIIVNAGAGESSCGIDFVQGESYLVFAYETEHHELVTRLCSRTRALSSASEDLAALGEGKLPSKQVDLSGDVGGGPLDTVRLYAYYWFGKLTSPNGWGWLSVAFLSAFFFAAAGFGLRRHAFLRHAAVFAGTGSAVFGILLWVILIFFNPYHDVISADTLWITFALMPPPAGLALISAARRSAAGLLATGIWSLPLGLYLAATPGIFRWFGAAVFLYFIAALWSLAARRR
ncbi:hypothetical protein LJK88_40105 [Paenibacillus sp. P26]|nr:hypothetical protein LJK88_40105 [Paenibacillus sp. P26]